MASTLTAGNVVKGLFATTLYGLTEFKRYTEGYVRDNNWIRTPDDDYCEFEAYRNGGAEALLERVGDRLIVKAILDENQIRMRQVGMSVSITIEGI